MSVAKFQSSIEKAATEEVCVRGNAEEVRV